MGPLDVVIFGVPLVALTAGVVELLKQAFGLPARRAPIVAVFVAGALTALNALRLGVAPTPALGAEWALLGVVYGLAASGLYDHVERLTGGGSGGDDGARSDVGRRIDGGPRPVDGAAAGDPGAAGGGLAALGDRGSAVD